MTCGIVASPRVSQRLAARVAPLVVLAAWLNKTSDQLGVTQGCGLSLQRGVCEGADLVVANSDYTRRLVIRSAPRAKVAAVPGVVITGASHQVDASERARSSVAGDC